MSTVEALQTARMDQAFIDGREVGIIFGNDSSAKAVIESTDIIREKVDTMMAGSAAVFQNLNSTVNMNLSTIFRLKGVNFTISAACASGSHSIGIGYLLIQQGLQDCVICGGAQEVNIFSMGTFDALGAFSIREDEPTKASRPFDKNRDGLVPSGGAATVILESLESAQKRGAPILAEVIGYGFSSNGAHISNPSVDGPVRALKMSLKNAGISASDVDYINAHATSTPAGDASEAKALHEVFGGSRPYVSSTKSMTGHECWMAGASEVVYSILMMKNNFIAPNINFEEADEDSALLNLATKTIEQKLDVVLSNSFGFGGTNSSLILKNWNP
jgi:3-oxoacyl-[acyl-carrier-protein] synthase-1